MIGINTLQSRGGVKDVIEDDVLPSDMQNQSSATAVWAEAREHGAEASIVKRMGEGIVQACYCTK